jgi:hypothetical protein
MRVLCLTVSLLQFAGGVWEKENDLPRRRKTVPMFGIGPRRRLSPTVLVNELGILSARAAGYVADRGGACGYGARTSAGGHYDEA